MLGILLCGLKSPEYKRKEQEEQQQEYVSFPKPSYYPKSIDICQLCGHYSYLIGWNKEELKCVKCARFEKENQKND
jgi:hypothetical protein